MKAIKLLFLLFLFGFLNSSTYAEEVTLKNNTLLYPKNYQDYEFQWSAGAMLTNMPKDWVETAIRAPIFAFNFKFGLPENFSVSADAEVLFVSNQIRLGPRWGFDYENFAFNIGYDIGYVFGQLKQFGYDNSVNAWYNYPNISIGANFADLFFTLQGELMVMTTSSVTTDGIEVDNDANQIFGGTISLYLEQKLWADRIFIFGIKNNITKFYYPAWPVFTTFDRLYWIPQIHMGVVL